MQSQTIINMTTTNYQLIVSEDISLNGKLFISGDVSMGGNLAATSGTSANTYMNIYGKAPPSSVYGNLVVSPNTTNATSSTWINNNITWTASASSTIGGTYYTYFAFNTTNTLGTSQWASAVTYLSTGLYNGSVSTAIFGQSGQLGEWLQIQSSVPAVMNTYTFSAGGSINNMPKTYWIVGSNDGSTWYPIQLAAFTANPFTASTTLSSVFNVNTSGSQTAGATTVTTTIYGSYTTGSYTYFRLIFNTLWSGASTTTEISEWTPTFTLPTVTGPSRALLYMDPSNINQLDVSGSLALVNKNLTLATVMPNAMSAVTPNAVAATSNSWLNNGVTWYANASSILSAAWDAYKAFNTISNAEDAWHDNGLGYGVSTGVAFTTNLNFQTTVFTTGSSGGTSVYYGQWLQIQSNVPLIISTFWFGARQTLALRLPKIFYIVGSNAGTGTWTPIFKGDTTSTTGATNSGTVTLTGLANSGTIANFYGSTALTYTTYGNLASSFTYFRLIVSNLCGAADTCNIGEWGLTFATTTTTTTTMPSSVSLALDNVVPNQLNVGGAMNVGGTLGIAGGITPMYSTLSFGPGQVGYSYFAPVPKDISVALNSSAELARLTNVPPGVWLVCTCMCYYGSATNARVKLYVGTTSGITDVLGVQMIQIVNGDYMGHSGSIVYTNLTTNTFYLNMAVNAAGPVKTYTESEKMSFIQATRIA
jgi:hypothetical protein